MEIENEEACKKIKDIPYDLELEKILRSIRDLNATRVLLQSPPGLKKYMPVVADCIKKSLKSLSVSIYLEDSYGACDLIPDNIINMLKADLVIHFGHTPYPRDLSPGGGGNSNYLFIPTYSKLKIDATLVQNVIDKLNRLELKRIGLVASLQHVKELNRLASYLRHEGFTTLIPPAAPPFLLRGQVLGCDYRLALYIKNKVDSYIIISGGKFHPLGLYLSTKKTVIKLDPYERKVTNFTKEGEKVLKIRMFKIMKSLDIKRWGVIIGAKTGQYRPKLVETILAMLRKRKLKYRILVSKKLTRSSLDDLSETFDGFVVTSCPRVAIDDLGDYRKPVLTPGEFRMILEEKLSRYIFPW